MMNIIPGRRGPPGINLAPESPLMPVAEAIGAGAVMTHAALVLPVEDSTQPVLVRMSMVAPSTLPLLVVPLVAIPSPAHLVKALMLPPFIALQGPWGSIKEAFMGMATQCTCWMA